MNDMFSPRSRRWHRLSVAAWFASYILVSQAFAQCDPTLPPPPPDDLPVLLSYTLNGQTVQADPSGSFVIPNVSAPDFAPADFVGDDFLLLTGVMITSQQTLYAYGRIPFQIVPGGQFVFDTGKQDFLTFSTTPPVLPDSISLTTTGNSIITPLALDGQCPNAVPCSVPLQTTATQSNGMQEDVTLPSMWTTYRTSNASIARVVPDNPMTPTAMLVEGISPGVAFITATNGGATSVVKITVANPANLISTTVEGFVRRIDPAAANGTSPVNGAAITVQLQTTGPNGEPTLQQVGSGTSGATGFFSINPVTLPDTATEIFADATTTINSLTEFGRSTSVAPVPSGITDVGIITIDIVCDTPWSTAFGPTTFEGFNIFTMAVYDDDGPGMNNPPALFVGGSFTSAGGTTANNIAKWDGRRWVPLIGASGVNAGFNGVNAEVQGLTVVDLQDGNGPALYAVGRFIRFGGPSDSGPGANKIARWDGTDWSTLGAGVGTSEDEAFAVAGFDDGTSGGMELYVGGSFLKAGGVDQGNNCLPGFACVTSPSIAKWNPRMGATGQWLAVGGGTDDFGKVKTLTVHDDGSGTALFAGGQFFQMNGANVRNVARWNGSVWTEVGTGGLSGFSDIVNILTVFDFDGTAGQNPPELYAGGSFGFSPALDVARWNGSIWEPLGPGLNDVVTSLVGVDDGVNRVLYAAGLFDKVGGGGPPLEKIAAWDGASWSDVGTGIESFNATLTVFDDGAGPALYVGGSLADGTDCVSTGGGIAGTTQGYIAKWDNSTWSVLGNGLNDEVQAMVVHDDGSGAALFAGGSFTPPKGPCDQNAPPFPINAVAKFDGAKWSSLGTGMDCVGIGCVTSVNALAVFDEDGPNPNPPRLFAGGEFALAGNITANNVARWDGTNWSAVGDGGTGDVGGIVEALAVFDDGTGSTLYAGGLFANGIKMWNGAAWTTLGSGVAGGSVFAVAAFDDGSGSKLYVGGSFSDASSVSGTSFIARWDGSTWSALGTGVPGLTGSVYALTVFDDGTGPALYAGGEFLMADGNIVNRVAKWDGISWSAVSDGLGPTTASTTRVDTLFSFDNGSGPFLVAGGDFITAPIAGGATTPLNRLAKWNQTSNAWLPIGISGTISMDPGGVDICTGVGCTVRVNALTAFDNGIDGPALFAGGTFETATGIPSSNIAKLGCR